MEDRQASASRGSNMEAWSRKPSAVCMPARDGKTFLYSFLHPNYLEQSVKVIDSRMQVLREDYGERTGFPFWMNSIADKHHTQ